MSALLPFGLEMPQEMRQECESVEENADTNHTIRSYCVYRDGPGGLMCVPKELPIITFTLWCTRLTASLTCRYGKQVTLVKTLINYMGGKGVKIAIFKIFPPFVLVPLANHGTDKLETW